MPTHKKRHVIRWRTKKLADGTLLKIAVTKEKGPRGGRTLGYPIGKGKTKVYPATTATRKVRVTKKKRTVKVRRRG